MQVRFARATDHIDEAKRFYVDGLGLDVLGSFVDHSGFDGVMIGRRGESWHLELTHQRGATVGEAPSAENLIVLYFDDDAAWDSAVARMRAHGYAPTPSHNPYWDARGATFLDVDGYGVVLQRGLWAPDLRSATAPARAMNAGDAPRGASRGGEDAAGDAPHSAQFLTDARDLYWNDDFLALMSARLGLKRARRAVDVGCGLGHWTRRVAGMLASGAEITGVDREPKWVNEAKRASDDGEVRIRYVEGSADALPFPDASVDVVTCQTVLIHVGDPARVLREMRRILKPGGTLLAAEPNNIGGNITPNVWPPGEHVDDTVAVLRLEIVCSRGKYALGQGFNSLGENLVGYLDDAAWENVRVWNSDRAYVARAPYPDDARAMLAQERAWFDQGAYMWPEDETRRYFLAGGGSVDEFAALWAATKRHQARRFRAVDDGTYAAACGGFLYLVAATKRVGS